MLPMSEIEEVFSYWQIRLNKPKSKLDAKRRRLIQARLTDGYTLDDLRTAIDGCAISEFHNGKNDRHQTYNDISLICRDAEHVDKFMGLAQDRERKVKRDADYRARLQ